MENEWNLRNDDIIESEADPVLQEDLEGIAEGSCPLEVYAGTTILVTGATGLIGSQIVKALACANRKKDLQIRILALARSREKAQKVFGRLLDRGDVVFVQGDVNQELVVEEPVDYIVHGASATSSRYFVTNPVETIRTALDGTRHVLELGQNKQVKGMVYLSSLEVYGVPDGGLNSVKEEDYGYIDPLSVRSSYSEGKRMAECLCVAYADEYQVPVKIVRLSQTFGAGVAYEDGRVFAEFARCVIEKRNIVLHTAGNTLRTYCYTADAVNGILTVLARGEKGQAYNISNKDTGVTIREMAEIVCHTFPESGIAVTFDMPADLQSYGYNPEMVIRLNTDKLEQLGWRAQVSLPEMYRRMIRSFGK